MDAYRVQHKDFGFGPYASSFWPIDEICSCGEGLGEWTGYHDENCDAFGILSFSEYICENSTDSDRHPIPSNDGIGEWWFGERIFGFPNLDELHNWFDEFKNDLIEFGFEIVKYCDVKDFVIGRKQIVFLPGDTAPTGIDW